MENYRKTDTVLIDTGIIYALADTNDSWHDRAAGFASNHRGRYIVPSPVIPEVCYLLNNYLSQSAELAFINSLINKELSIEHVTLHDLQRCLELMAQYSDLNIGLVDASMVTIADRLKIKVILTTDRKHFSVIKPKHCEYFQLLP